MRLALPAGDRERNLTLLALAQFVGQFSFIVVFPLLPLYVRELGANTPESAALWAGLAFGITPLFGAISTPWWGRRAAHDGYKKAIERVILGTSVAMVLLAVVGSLWQVLLLRAAVGALGGFTALLIAATLVVAGREQATRAVVRLQAAQAAAMITGPLLGGVLADHVGIRPTMGIAGLVCLASFVAFRYGYRDLPLQRSPAAAASPATRAGWIGPLAVALFVAQFADSSLGPVLPGFLLLLAAPGTWLGSLTGLTVSAGALAAAIGASVVSRRYPRAQLGQALPWVLAGGALSWAGLAAAAAWWQVPVLRAVAGLSIGAVPTIVYGLAAQRIGGPSLGALVTRLSAATMLGSALAPLASGIVLRGSAHSVLALDALLMLAAALSAWGTYRALALWWSAARRYVRALVSGVLGMPLSGR